MAERDCSCECEGDEKDLSPKEAESVLIEEERTRLMQASSVLGCLIIGISEVDGLELEHGAPVFSEVAEVARGLVEEVIGNLDSVERKRVRREAGETEPAPEPDPDSDNEEPGEDEAAPPSTA